MSAPTNGVQITDLKINISGARQGFLTATFPSGARFHDCIVFKKEDKWWVSPASRAVIGKDGQQQKDADGKLKWVPVVSFTDRSRRDAWSNAIISALHRQHPEVLG